MAQLRKHSLLETVCSTTFGYFIAIAAQKIIFPLFGFYMSLEQNFGIAAAFTVVSLVRGYVFRRIFNHFTGG